MQRFNRKVEYALIALKHLIEISPTKPRSSANEIASTFGIPFDATARSLQLLAQAGLLKVEQGLQGGYSYIPGHHSLLDVLVAVEGAPSVSRCVSPDAACEMARSCNITGSMQQLNDRLTEFYRSIELHEFLSVWRLRPVESAVVGLDAP